MLTFGWKWPDLVFEYVVQAESLAAAKAKLREKLGLSRLPPGFQVWDAQQRPVKRWVIAEPLPFG